MGKLHIFGNDQKGRLRFYSHIFTRLPPAALFGVLFEKNKEAAFASYRLWEALGFVIAFGYSMFLCVSVKLYVLLGVLSLAMAAYGTVEYLGSKKVARQLTEEQTKPAEEGVTQTKT